MKKSVVEFLKEKLEDGHLDISNSYWNELLMEAETIEKEQMCSFAEFVATYPDKNNNYLGEMLHAKSKYDGAERTIDLLETFKSE